MRTTYKIFLSAVALVGAFVPQAVGQVRGVVYDTSTTPSTTLAGASVYWAGTNIGVATDDSGTFNIGLAKGYDRLVASYIGFSPDTLTVTSASDAVVFRLRPGRIEAVEVTATNRGNYTALDGILKGEVISFSGLTKMACCNLAESFENSASVTVGYSDAITGARQIRLLGLAGIYTQILDETRPVMRGLGSMYGLGYTPGMWLEGIQLSKGVTSVTSGHEAISGQINLEHRKPTDESPLFLNVYLDDVLRTEINTASTHRITDKLSHVVLGHFSINPLRTGHNGDGFMDSPVGNQVNIADRFLYVADNGIQMRAGLKYVDDSRLAGQMDYEPYSNRNVFDPLRPYGSETANRNFNGYFKLAVPLGKYVYDEEAETAERSNLAFILDYNHFRTNSYFGQMKDYRAKQNSLYFNGMYSWNINVHHKLITGVSLQTDNYREYLRDGQTVFSDAHNYIGFDNDGRITGRSESEAGVFAEYSYNYKDRFALVAGIRGDYSDHYGIFYTPRAHVKWNILPKLVLRGSAGKGYRSANPVADNIWVLATGRTLLNNFDTKLHNLEESLTYGGSLTWHFRLGADDNASLSVDCFRTEFQSQLIADQEYDVRNVVFYNLQGPSYTNTYQADFNWTPAKGFDVLLTFRYNDTAVTLTRPDGSRTTVEKPLTDRYKGLVNLQYATRFRRWVFDLTAQINGPSRLPSLTADPGRKEYSPAYPMFFVQVTYRPGKRTSLYAGCENIGNYIQKDPIYWEKNVHDASFNSSRIWGPLMGRKFYAGARITF